MSTTTTRTERSLPALAQATATNAGLEITFDPAEATSSDHAIQVTWRWLRDHGEDEASFDPATKQRRVYALDAEEPQPATRHEFTTIDGEPVLELWWPDAATSTWISVATLRSVARPTMPAARSTWHEPAAAAPTVGVVDRVLEGDDALAAWLDDVHTHGYGLLRGFRGGHDEITALADRIGRPMSTIFGTVWDLASDVVAHEDTAYTQTFLAPHTDGTYLHHAPRLQMFCCTERDGTGGESIIVDGFAIAETLRNDFPDDFRVLTTTPVPANYLEPGVEARACRPAILLDEHGQVAQVSMNNYDRSPMLLPPADMDAFYRAYGRLHDLANDRDRWRSIRLEAGDVLINDNWRVLHGREAYTGGRRFVGCYVGHDDYESRLRTLGLA